MTANSISTLSLQLLATNNLQAEQTQLATLNQQLASGTQFDNLTDYTPTDAHNLMDFQNAVTQKQSYIASMQTVSTRLSLYDQTMTDMETITSQAQTLASQNQNLDPSKIAQLNAQIQTYLKEVSDDLNQQVSGRYIYAGARYSTKPVVDLTTLSGTPTYPFTPTTSPTLPNYDSQYNPPTTTTSTAAFTQDTVNVDSSFNVTYGVTSTNPAFQQLVGALQTMNAATQSGVSGATYETDMTNASTLLGTALAGIQAVHATVANNQNIMTNETSTQNTDINNLQAQLSNIQQVNLTQVGTEINLLQTQLSASYSATASLEQLSIVKYL